MRFFRLIPLLREGEPGNDGNGDNKPITQKDFNGVAAMITRLNKTIETLAATAMTPEKLADELAKLNLVEKGEDGKIKPKTTAPETKPEVKPAEGEKSEDMKKLEAKLAAMNAEIEKSRDDLRKKDEDLARKDAEREAQERDNAVRAALNKAGAINPDRDYVHIMRDKLVRNDKGEWVLPGKGQYGEEVFTPVGDLATKYLKDNPELARATVKTGTGGGGVDGQGNPPTQDQVRTEMKSAFESLGMKGTHVGKARVIATTDKQ